MSAISSARGARTRPRPGSLRPQQASSPRLPRRLGLVVLVASVGIGGTGFVVAGVGASTARAAIAAPGAAGDAAVSVPARTLGAAAIQGDDLGQVAARLDTLAAYRFRIELTGAFARGGPVRGSDVVVTGTVVQGIGRLVRFDASGAGAEPSVTYLERGGAAWLLLPTGRWLSVVPDDNSQPGTFTRFFPSAFYATYDWPWIQGARLIAGRGSSAVSGPGGVRRYAVDPQDLLGRAMAEGANDPSGWSLTIAVATSSGALQSAAFFGRTSDGSGRTNAFGASLLVFPLRRATLPNPG